MSFSFYTEPVRLLPISHGGVSVGLGFEEAEGVDKVYLNVGDGYRHDGSVELNKADLKKLIDHLAGLHAEMDTL